MTAGFGRPDDDGGSPSTTEQVPAGARPVARVLLLDAQDRLLLLRAVHAADGYTFWVAPGGGLEAGERFEDAARRELHEETGLDLQVDRWVWTRRHRHVWNGQPSDQYERFFVARTDSASIAPIKPDGHVTAYRWWTLSQLLCSNEEFAPQRLTELITDIIRGDYPDEPIDCGI
jgi:8-oxo-dGTP pyrophosphatase MutT (NUDIX family)